MTAQRRTERATRLCHGSILVVLAFIASPAQSQPAPWIDVAASADARADLLIRTMTLAEKEQQLGMNTGPNPDLPACGVRRDSRHIEGIPRLAIPTVRMTNGPIGVSGGDCAPDPQTTGLPTALAVAATFDPGASYAWGDVAGRESRATANAAFYAPGVNLGRIANNGRNFEYFGEDPYLAGVMAVAQIRAVQAHGVHAVVKHLVANEQETDRVSSNSIVADQPLHELYLLPFEMAVRDARVAGVMCSYPQVNSVSACESSPLLATVLRGQLGFDGYVVSDRGATHSTAKAIKAGLDLELASKALWFNAERIDAALAAREIAGADVDALLRHRYATMMRFGQFDSPIARYAPIDFQSHGQVARRVAAEGIVLLKNDGAVLPLAARSLRSVAVIGAKTFAGEAKFPVTGPAGIISVNAPYTIAPAAGIRNALAALGADARVTYDDGTDLARATALASIADVAIVMAGDISLENVDRANLSLPTRDGVDQDALIAAIARANPRTVVVLKDGGPVLMPWLDAVPAVLEAWYAGQEDGNAVADVLFGFVNPSARLPMTFPARERAAASATVEQWPGLLVDGVRTVAYTEGLRMGYRWYDATGETPLFPFGFGLSYTSFAYSDFKVGSEGSGDTMRVTARFTLRNTGTRAGADIAQVYAGFAAGSEQPPKRLVGFQRVTLEPGEQRDVSIIVDAAASHHPVSRWDSDRQSWERMTGPITFSLARSARGIEASARLAEAAQ